MKYLEINIFYKEKYFFLYFISFMPVARTFPFQGLQVPVSFDWVDSTAVQTAININMGSRNRISIVIEAAIIIEKNLI